MSNSPIFEKTASAQQPDSVPAGQNLMWYLNFWPAIVAGLIISVGIIGLSPNRSTALLIWLPVFLLAAFLLYAIVSLPHPKKHKEEPWDRRAREAAEKQPATAAIHTSGAEVPAAALTESTETVLSVAPTPVAPVVAGDVDVLILWGSETGTAQGLAEMSEARLKDTGLSARAVSMGSVTLNQLPGFGKVLMITSTWGDGEPPSNAIDLWEAFQKQKVDLSATGFSVLSLGDTAYPEFCKCGKDFDAFLAAQGAKRLYPRIDCDLDYEANFEKWLSGVQQVVAK